MKENDINKIINNALLVDKKNLFDNIKPILKNIKISIKDNQDILLQANKIDTKNNNAFQLSFDIIDNIFKRVEKENIFYKDVTLLQKDDNKKIIYGKQIMDYGNVVIITDGNPYLSLEMILRNIMAGNTIILVNNGFMYGTNNLIVNIVQSILENYKVSKNLIQLFITDDYKEVLNNYANIDLVVFIGNHELQRLIIRESKNKVITSGYENFDLYIEDTKHLDFLNKIINTGLNVNLYINKDTNLDYDTAIIVSDIDEAIAQINYNGSRYSSAIFTSSNFNASKFIREVKSSIVTVNTSPTIERICDIKQLDLVYEKTIIYPYEFNIEKIVK
jgi:gamma-glutamyl phosphate reductase